MSTTLKCLQIPSSADCLMKSRRAGKNQRRWQPFKVANLSHWCSVLKYNNLTFTNTNTQNGKYILPNMIGYKYRFKESWKPFKVVNLSHWCSALKYKNLILQIQIQIQGLLNTYHDKILIQIKATKFKDANLCNWCSALVQQSYIYK